LKLLTFVLTFQASPIEYKEEVFFADEESVLILEEVLHLANHIIDLEDEVSF
jgi:hypothetical protein